MNGPLENCYILVEPKEGPTDQLPAPCERHILRNSGFCLGLAENRGALDFLELPLIHKIKKTSRKTDKQTKLRKDTHLTRT